MWEEFYVIIYRVEDGLRAILASEEGMRPALERGENHTIEVDCEREKLRFFVAYPKTWEPEQAIYLVETQIKYWPCFTTGEKLPELRGGMGGSAWATNKTKGLFADDGVGGGQ